mmetsp:Transcript_52842/g.123636  ORF Transcript_52842/g.123636 Transcript_52842/m.123636 type:complete len:336 (+) Transcript_52842:48-1055(+)
MQLNSYSLPRYELEVRGPFVHFRPEGVQTLRAKSLPPSFAPRAARPSQTEWFCDRTLSTASAAAGSGRSTTQSTDTTAEELAHEEKLKAIGCRGCGCQILKVCEHAQKGTCNKRNCRYCHCSVRSLPGSGTPAVKQSTRKYVERLLDGELNGKQYLTLLSRMLGGVADMRSAPAWLTDAKEVQSIATCLVLAFTQGCKVSMARDLVLRICEWMLGAQNLRSEGLARFFEQLRVEVAKLNLKDWQMRSEELSMLRAFPCRYFFDTSNWPKESDEENGLSASPWLGVFRTISTAFAWALFFQHPESQLFRMNNMLGFIVRDTGLHIQSGAYVCQHLP